MKIEKRICDACGQSGLVSVGSDGDTERCFLCFGEGVYRYIVHNQTHSKEE